MVVVDLVSNIFYYKLASRVKFLALDKIFKIFNYILKYSIIYLMKIYIYNEG